MAGLYGSSLFKQNPGTANRKEFTLALECATDGRVDRQKDGQERRTPEVVDRASSIAEEPLLTEVC